MLETIVFFDGHCNLCNNVVQFIIKRDRKARFKFCALQSEAARLIFFRLGYPPPNNDTIILLEKQQVYHKSTAALRILKGMDHLWPLLYVGVIVPAFLRDWIYNRIAKNRFRILGRSTHCMVPNKNIENRFINYSA